MTRPHDPAEMNPYAAPAAVDDQLPLQLTGNARVLLQQFRAQMHGLAVLWLVVGITFTAISFAIISGELFFLGSPSIYSFDGIAVGLFILTAGGLWLVAGLMTLFKQLWAVYLGLVGSYLVLLLIVAIGIASRSVGTLVPIMLFAIAVVQSHRVIGWAKELLNHGIPLTTRL